MQNSHVCHVLVYPLIKKNRFEVIYRSNLRTLILDGYENNTYDWRDYEIIKQHLGVVITRG